MSYWSHHPEELDEVTTKNLPDEWKELVENDEVDLQDVPEQIRFDAMDKGIEDYWADKTDLIRDEMKARREE